MVLRGLHGLDVSKYRIEENFSEKLKKIGISDEGATPMLDTPSEIRAAQDLLRDEYYKICGPFVNHLVPSTSGKCWEEGVSEADEALARLHRDLEAYGAFVESDEQSFQYYLRRDFEPIFGTELHKVLVQRNLVTGAEQDVEDDSDCNVRFGGYQKVIASGGMIYALGNDGIVGRVVEKKGEKKLMMLVVSMKEIMGHYHFAGYDFVDGGFEIVREKPGISLDIEQRRKRFLVNAESKLCGEE